ncbi:MAG: SLC13 family permease [Candidatus Marinimicrobia bacterium]|nr:SLC13 family permease [Candidatus Neomarinimicrobiota bacterium]
MDTNLILFIAIIGISIFAFIREWFPIEVTALLALAALLLSGLVTPEEAVIGFSDHAVITIGAMFVLSHAFSKTGFIRSFTAWLEKIGRGSRIVVISLFLFSVALFSGFINNTAAVAILIPVGLQLSSRLKLSPSKIMMPLSFAAIVGGTCTIIGTSTNLVVYGIARGYNLDISFFEMAKLGVIFSLVTIIYSLIAGKWILPSRLPVSGLTKKYKLATYLTEAIVGEDSPLIGRNCIECGLGKKYGITLLDVIRDKKHITTNIRNEKLKNGDILLIQCEMDAIMKFKKEQGVLLLTDLKLNDDELNDQENHLVEVMVSPNSQLAGKSLMDIDFRRRYGTFVLAVKHQRKLLRKKIAHIILRNFDTLLIFGPKTRTETLKNDPNFIVLDELDMTLHKIKFWWVAIAVIPLVVILAATKIMPIMEASLLGAILLVAIGVVTPQEAYKSINWTVIFLIAAFIPLGAAMERVHFAEIFGNFFMNIYGTVGGRGLIAIFFFITMLMTSFLSNNATAIILTPLAILTAQQLDLNALPFVLTVMFAASLSFMTPNGYQTNAMVYSPGGYKYTDFMRAGAPLHLILWILGSLLIPLIWEL